MPPCHYVTAPERVSVRSVCRCEGDSAGGSESKRGNPPSSRRCTVVGDRLDASRLREVVMWVRGEAVRFFPRAPACSVCRCEGDCTGGSEAKVASEVSRSPSSWRSTMAGDRLGSGRLREVCARGDAARFFPRGRAGETCRARLCESEDLWCSRLQQFSGILVDGRESWRHSAQVGCWCVAQTWCLNRQHISAE